MRYRKLDENKDMIFGNGGGDYLSDLEAVTQSIFTRLSLLKGEWWEDTEDGLPLFQEIFSSKDMEKVKKIITERIQKTKHVKIVYNIEVLFNNTERTFSYSADVETEFGTTYVYKKYGEAF